MENSVALLKPKLSAAKRRIIEMVIERLMQGSAGSTVLMIVVISLSLSGAVIPPLLKRFPGLPIHSACSPPTASLNVWPKCCARCGKRKKASMPSLPEGSLLWDRICLWIASMPSAISSTTCLAVPERSQSKATARPNALICMRPIWRFGSGHYF